MQAIIISALDMWPASVTNISTNNSPPTTSANTPYRPFEELVDLNRPNPFPSPEPPAPPPVALSPPLSGSQWILSPPTDDRSNEEPVRYVNHCFFCNERLR